MPLPILRAPQETAGIGRYTRITETTVRRDALGGNRWIIRSMRTSDDRSPARQMDSSGPSSFSKPVCRTARNGFILFSILFILTTGIRHSGAEDITLQWDRSPSKTTVGYRVYSGTVQGGYDRVVDVGNVTFYVVRGLSADRRHLFTVTAYDSRGSESRHSNQVFWGPEAIRQNLPGDAGGSRDFVVMAYGSPRAREVLLLKRFRDRHLQDNWIGRLLIDIYDSVSPPLADLVARSETFRVLTRWGLAPVVYVLQHPRRSAVVFVACTAAVAVGLVWFRSRKNRSIS